MKRRKITPWRIMITSILAYIVITSIGWIATAGLSLMNESSNAAVLVGIFLVVIAAAALLSGGTIVYRFLKKYAIYCLLIATTLLTTGCVGCNRINAGEVGIVIQLAGDDRGVGDIPLETGWVFYNMLTKQVFIYPTFVQTMVWTLDEREGSRTNEQISFNSKNGLTITADISLSYKLDPQRVPAFYVEFRSDDLRLFTSGFMRNAARSAFNDAASLYTADEIYGERKSELVIEARQRFEAALSAFGVEIVQLGFVGAPRPPKSVLDAISRKVEAVQKAEQAENELQLAQANAAKAVATAEGELSVSRLRAEQNVVLARSIDSSLIEWRELELREAAIAKWNGAVPNVDGGGTGFSLLLNPKQ